MQIYSIYSSFASAYIVDNQSEVKLAKLFPTALLNTFWLFFETLAIRDLRTYADALMGQVAHYRDADKLECDAVIHLRDGRYRLIEIKFGGDTLIKEGVESLMVFMSFRLVA